MNYSLNHPIFKKISECADKLNLPCFVIGGFVRDLILKRESNDIDVVVLGSGIEMATELKKTLGKGSYLSVFYLCSAKVLKYR